jgi:hypothetical protein
MKWGAIAPIKSHRLSPPAVLVPHFVVLNFVPCRQAPGLLLGEAKLGDASPASAPRCLLVPHFVRPLQGCRYLAAERGTMVGAIAPPLCSSPTSLHSLSGVTSLGEAKLGDEQSHSR